LIVALLIQDGHEICFFEDEGFGKFCEVDPNAEQLLLDAIQMEGEPNGGVGDA